MNVILTARGKANDILAQHSLFLHKRHLVAIRNGAVVRERTRTGDGIDSRTADRAGPAGDRSVLINIAGEGGKGVRLKTWISHGKARRNLRLNRAAHQSASREDQREEIFHQFVWGSVLEVAFTAPARSDKSGFQK